MKELLEPNEWQKIDGRISTMFPWYVESFLEVLATWDLYDKVIWEYGLGASSIWWAYNSKAVYGVDSNKEWYNGVKNRLTELNISDKTYLNYAAVIEEDQITDYNFAFANECKNAYINAIHIADIHFDIVVVDGLYRDECIAEALKKMKPGAILIVDNWQQPSVWMANEETLRLLEPYEKKVYKQNGHPDWQTAIFFIK